MVVVMKSDVTQRSFSVGEVASKLQVSDQTVRNWIKDGWLPAHQNGVRQMRIRQSDLEEFQERRGGSAMPPTTLLTGFIQGGWVWAMQWIGQFRSDAVMDMGGWKFAAKSCYNANVAGTARPLEQNEVWIQYLLLAIYDWFELSGWNKSFTVADFQAVLESVKGFAVPEEPTQESMREQLL